MQFGFLLSNLSFEFSDICNSGLFGCQIFLMSSRRFEIGIIDFQFFCAVSEIQTRLRGRAPITTARSLSLDKER